MALSIAFFLVSAIVVIKAASDGSCRNCKNRNHCHVMNRFDTQQQELWMNKYHCQDPYHDVRSGLRQFLADRDLEFVCCSNIEEEIKTSIKIFNQMSNKNKRNDVETDLQKQQSGQLRGSEGLPLDTHSNYKQTKSAKYYSITPRPTQPYNNNNNPSPHRAISLDATNIAPLIGKKQNLREQCVATSFPPKPETECCGREASDTGRITETESSHLISDLVSLLSTWIPDNSVFSPLSNNNLLPSLLWLANNRRRRALSDKLANVTIDQRIAGGKATEFEQYPWTVLLQTTFDYGDRVESYNCGGSLISSKYVLTAAHCLHHENSKLTSAEVYLAEYNKQTFPRDCKNVLGVGEKCIENLKMYAENVILHSQFDPLELLNDIALIRLRGNAPYTEYIRPICILSPNLDSPEYSNTPLEVAGWGRNGPYRSDIKQSTVVNLVPQEQCKKYYPDLSTKHMCAVGHTGEDTCKGDSGGPLMTVYAGKYFVVGIVSGKRADYPCGTSAPSLYTNVYHYLDWIINNIKN